jgi:hypothetical protein
MLCGAILTRRKFKLRPPKSNGLLIQKKKSVQAVSVHFYPDFAAGTGQGYQESGIKQKKNSQKY